MLLPGWLSPLGEVPCLMYKYVLSSNIEHTLINCFTKYFPCALWKLYLTTAWYRQCNSLNAVMICVHSAVENGGVMSGSASVHHPNLTALQEQSDLTGHNFPNWEQTD